MTDVDGDILGILDEGPGGEPTEFEARQFAPGHFYGEVITQDELESRPPCVFYEWCTIVLDRLTTHPFCGRNNQVFVTKGGAGIDWSGRPKGTRIWFCYNTISPAGTPPDPKAGHTNALPRS